MSNVLVFTPASKGEALSWWYTTQNYAFSAIFEKREIRIPADEVVGCGKWRGNDLLYFWEGNRIGYLRLSGKVPKGFAPHRIPTRDFVREVLTSPAVLFVVLCVVVYAVGGKPPLRVVGPLNFAILTVGLHLLLFSRSKKYSYSHKADLIMYGMLVVMGLGFRFFSFATA